MKKYKPYVIFNVVGKVKTCVVVSCQFENDTNFVCFIILTNNLISERRIVVLA